MYKLLMLRAHSVGSQDQSSYECQRVRALRVYRSAPPPLLAPRGFRSRRSGKPKKLPSVGTGKGRGGAQCRHIQTTSRPEHPVRSCSRRREVSPGSALSLAGRSAWNPLQREGNGKLQRPRDPRYRPLGDTRRGWRANEMGKQRKTRRFFY